jgi:SAM-dependent methyltransferase
MIRVLQSLDEIGQARSQLAAMDADFTDRSHTRLWRLLYRLRFRRAMPDADRMKSWDVMHALKLIRQHVTHGAAVLDMGCYNSEILWALHRSGFRRLAGCDLNPLCRWMPYWHRIDYQLADLTRTPFGAGSMSAITCLSVVEHGVPIDGLVAEARRLLKPGGVFIFTTDFDGTGATHEIDPEFRVFEQSWQIFSRETLRQLTDKFLAAGFVWLEPDRLSLDHTERPIHWNNQDYTFAMVGLRAQ